MRFYFPKPFSFGLSIASFLIAVLLFGSPAHANSKYAAIVIDARTGKVLHAENADSRRFPASLTKMMTLYMVFEAMESGKIQKNTRLPFSAQAAAQPPTKIGVRAGDSIAVEQAVLALITRSANDASTAFAELLGGSEQRFAVMMTQKARSLGMRNTVFRNPHGLPNEAQFTTARDMATLGIALREHFPQYYGYFSVKSFKYGRQRINNHNKLLGRIRGVDGIKTGYTRASGFNLVSSISDGNRRVVAVVMGGSSGGSRDARMAQLINANIGKARNGGGALVARADANPLSTLSAALLPKKNAPTPDWRPNREEIELASADEGEALSGEGDASPVSQAPTPAARPKQEVAVAALAMAPVQTRRAAAAMIDPTKTASTGAKGEWVIQIASSPNENDAKAALAKAKGMLADARGYTVPFTKDGTVYHRARFSGFDTRALANKTCGDLKRRRIACYVTQQD